MPTAKIETPPSRYNWEVEEDDDNGQAVNAASGFVSRAVHHLRSHWKILLCGQLLSLLTASGGAAQSTLHLHCDFSAPTFSMATVYFILAVVHWFFMTISQRKLRKEQRQYASDTHQVLLVDQPRYEFLNLQLKRPTWQYFIMALIDVEASATTILAFKYTTLTSVSLLDAFSIPSSLILSKLFLSRQYTWMHLVGVTACIIGVALNFLEDARSDLAQIHNANSTKTMEEEAYPHKLWGDGLAITGGILYGVMNVMTEATVRNNESTEEYLTMVGTFGCMLSVVQAFILERKEILEFFDRDSGASETCSVTKGWLLYFVFVGVVASGYMGASRFLMVSEATFFNLSLLTGDLWSVAFSVMAQSIVPGGLFFLALVIVVTGAVLYEMAPHPVVEDPHAQIAAQQLAEIDREFELHEAYDDEKENEDDDDEHGMELS